MQVACLAVLLTAGPAVAGAPAHQLRVIDARGDLLVSLPMPPGAGWCLAWNHSVEGFTVHDCYRNRDGRMVLERSHLPDFAAGLDHIPGRGRQVSDGQGGYWIEGIDEPVPGDQYRLRVGDEAVNHRLVSHGEPSLRRLVQCGRSAGGEVVLPNPVGQAPLTIRLSRLAADEAVTLGLYPPD
ncbi:DUF1850 domain-containing protein [Halomonas sp. 18H]|uniref:DUF1850 domain-containing protein n=1 Tax=Halomonas almeriensis TaxID=308163 RepID=UPI00223293D5|nr:MULTISPECIES: DUF1850 domain-containing protein [Halomonas]MCW4152726.1 DUF1850 domain-containing protein [Halomonas sp. 18H]MDN3552069.1 DUF1850 domain-containing protein [Halomonas almeriensis]